MSKGHENHARRGINTIAMNAAKIGEALSQHEKFKNQSTPVEDHIRIFPEISLCIERCWCHAKKYSRAMVLLHNYEK